MASSEGSSFRWEAFNRWCDEYATRHQGMKPKVEDVRKWHRENAEKVWPDSSERPSVFLAVSHNKGRRVRGHKTCEYYKRYRAGKAAEQQLAARLQPAALSGRRILAVTAAARKVNTDCGRTVGKRSSHDDILSEPGLEHQAADAEELRELVRAEKRRRMRSLPGPFGDAADPSRPGAGARGSSSDGVSDDPSWASGAGTSNEDGDEDDDSGSGVVAAAAPSAGRCTAHPYQHPHVTTLRAPATGPHAGVHITVVRRDADGRTIQVETQPARGGLQELSGRQSVYPYCVGGHGPAAAAAGVSVPGSRSGPENGGRVMGDEVGGNESGSGAESEGMGADLGPRQPQLRAFGWLDSDQQIGCPEQQSQHNQQAMQHQRQQSGGSAAAQGRVWGGQPGSFSAAVPADHPGIAPQACRRARSCAETEQRRPPHFSGYVATPFGSMPVYNVGSGGASGGDGASGRLARRRAQWASKGSGGAAAAAVVAAITVRDPLDLLAEAACDALDSPRPVGYDDDGVLGAAEPGRAAPADALGGVLRGDAAAGVAAAVVPETNACGRRWPSALQGGSCGSDKDCSKLMAPDRTRVKDGSDGEAASPRGAAASSDPFVALSEREPGRQLQQEPLVEAPMVGAVVKQQPSADGSERCDTAAAAGAAMEARCGAAVLAPLCDAGGLVGSDGVAAAAATRSGCGSGFGAGLALQQPQEPQQQHSEPPALSAPMDTGEAPSATIPLVQQAPRSPAGLQVATDNSDLSADGAAAKPADGGSSGAAADAGPAGPTTAAPSDFSLCPLPLMTDIELAAGRMAANVTAADAAAALLQGQQAKLSLTTAPGGVSLALEPVGAVPPPLQLSTLAAVAGGAALPGTLHAAAALPPPSLLWPALAGGMGSMLAGAPVLAAAAAPLFADASMLGGALAGAGGGGGGGGLLPMMLLQMQMATRGLDSNACHD